MRILLDECLPCELADELTGHEVSTVQKQVWSSVDNGDLLRRASGRFDVFLTVDKFIAQTRHLPQDLAVITIRARSNRIQDLRPLVLQI